MKENREEEWKRKQMTKDMTIRETRRLKRTRKGRRGEEKLGEKKTGEEVKRE